LTHKNFHLATGITRLAYCGTWLQRHLRLNFRLKLFAGISSGAGVGLPKC